MQDETRHVSMTKKGRAPSPVAQLPEKVQRLSVFGYAKFLIPLTSPCLSRMAHVRCLPQRNPSFCVFFLKASLEEKHHKMQFGLKRADNFGHLIHLKGPSPGLATLSWQMHHIRSLRVAEWAQISNRTLFTLLSGMRSERDLCPAPVHRHAMSLKAILSAWRPVQTNQEAPLLVDAFSAGMSRCKHNSTCFAPQHVARVSPQYWL